MDNKQALDSLGSAFNKAIDYHVMEYKLTYDEVIGCLEITKLGMYKEFIELDDK
jgi:hypothetical protein